MNRVYDPGERWYPASEVRARVRRSYYAGMTIGVVFVLLIVAMLAT